MQKQDSEEQQYFYNSHESRNQQQKNKNNQHKYQAMASSQIKIYNRNFYLREANHNLLRENHQAEILKLANRPKINAASYDILISKLQKTINCQINQIFCKQQRKDSNNLNYEDFSKIIIKLNNFQQANQIQVQNLISQLWLLLIEYNLQMFVNFLMVLMDPHSLQPEQINIISIQCNLLSENQQQKQYFLNQNKDLREETLTATNIFKLWVKIRQQTNLYKKKSDIFNLAYTDYSFQPKIGQKSRMYAEKSLNKYLSSSHLQFKKKFRSVSKKQNQLGKYLSEKYNMQSVQQTKIPYHQILYKRKLEKQNDSKIQQQDNQDFKIIKKASQSQIQQIVNNLYYKPQKKTDVNFRALQQQQNLQFCTFHPQINQKTSSKKYQTKPAPVRSFQKQITRYEKARLQKKKLQEAYQNLGRTKKNCLKSDKPSFIDRDTPKLILEINISQNHIQRIKLKGNQNPKLVAKKFILKYGLQQQMQSVLEQLIEENLQKL